MKKLTPVGGSKTVAAAGTPVALSATFLPVLYLIVQGKVTNTNPVHVGDSSVDNSTSPQISLDAGETFAIYAPEGLSIDLAEWYVDATTNGEGVDFVYAR